MGKIEQVSSPVGNNWITTGVHLSAPRRKYFEMHRLCNHEWHLSVITIVNVSPQ